MLGLKSSCEGKPRAQIFTAKLTALFSHASVHPTSGTRENRCETTDTADWPAAYVRSPGPVGRVSSSRSAIGRRTRVLSIVEPTPRDRRPAFGVPGLHPPITHERGLGRVRVNHSVAFPAVRDSVRSAAARSLTDFSRPKTLPLSTRTPNRVTRPAEPKELCCYSKSRARRLTPTSRSASTPSPWRPPLRHP